MLSKKSNLYTTIALFLVITIDTLGVGVVWPLFGPLIMGHKGAILPFSMPLLERDFLYGITIGIFPFCMFFGAPILGDLSDHVGRKKVLLICLYGTAIGFGICTVGVVWRSMYLLIFGRALLGLLAGSQATAQATIIDISAPEKKAISLSIITLASGFGFTLGPILGSVLIDKNIVHWFSITTPFTVSAILAMLNGTFLFIVFKETFFPKIFRRIHLTKGIKIFISAFRNVQMRMLALIYLLLQMGWALVFQYSVVFLVQDYGYTGIQVGHFLSMVSASFIVGLLIIMRIALRFFKLKNVIYWSLFIVSCSFSAAMWDKEIVIWLAMIPAAICIGLANTGLVTLVSNSVSKDEQGWAMGIIGAMSATAWGVGAVLGGVLGIFKFPIAFVVAGVMAFSGFVIAWRKIQH